MRITPQCSRHDEHWYSGQRPVKLCSGLYGFYLELYKDKFKNFIWAIKFKFSLPDLPMSMAKLNCAT
jgi:hypothetical protein